MGHTPSPGLVGTAQQGCRKVLILAPQSSFLPVRQGRGWWGVCNAALAGGRAKAELGEFRFVELRVFWFVVAAGFLFPGRSEEVFELNQEVI